MTKWPLFSLQWLTCLRRIRFQVQCISILYLKIDYFELCMYFKVVNIRKWQMEENYKIIWRNMYEIEYRWNMKHGDSYHFGINSENVVWKVVVGVFSFQRESGSMGYEAQEKGTSELDVRKGQMSKLNGHWTLVCHWFTAQTKLICCQTNVLTFITVFSRHTLVRDGYFLCMHFWIRYDIIWFFFWFGLSPSEWGWVLQSPCHDRYFITNILYVVTCRITNLFMLHTMHTNVKLNYM